MKKKDMADYGSEGVYYIFKVYKQNFSSKEKMNEFFALGLPVVKSMARRMRIPLYDFDEITERSQEAMVKLLREEAEREAKALTMKLLLCPGEFTLLEMAKLQELLAIEGVLD